MQGGPDSSIDGVPVEIDFDDPDEDVRLPVPPEPPADAEGREVVTLGRAPGERLAVRPAHERAHLDKAIAAFTAVGKELSVLR